MNRLMNAALWRCSVSDRPLELFFFCTSFLFLCIFSLEPSVLWTFTVLLDLPQFCVFQSELWTQFCTCQLFNGPNRKETSSCDLDAVIMLWSDYRSVINTSSWMLMCRILTPYELSVSAGSLTSLLHCHLICSHTGNIKPDFLYFDSLMISRSYFLHVVSNHRCVFRLEPDWQEVSDIRE